MTCEGTSPALIYIFDPSFDLKAGSISLKFCENFRSTTRNTEY